MHYLYAALIAALLATGIACDSEKKATPAPPRTSAQPPERTDSDADSAAAVVKAYYAAVKADDLEKAYELVSKTDREARSLEAFQVVAGHPTQKVLNAERNFKVGKARVDGDTARVYVEMEGPDVPKIQRTMLGEYVNEGKEVPPPEKLQVLIRERMSADGAPRATSRVEVMLVRDDGWRLDFDWDQENADRAIPQKDREAGEPTSPTSPDEPPAKN